MKIDETYFKGTDTEDSTSELSGDLQTTKKEPGDYMLAYSFVLSFNIAKTYRESFDELLSGYLSSTRLVSDSRNSVNMQNIKVFVDPVSDSVSTILGIYLLLHRIILDYGKSITKLGEARIMRTVIFNMQTKEEDEIEIFEPQSELIINRNSFKATFDKETGVNYKVLSSLQLYQYENILNQLVIWYGNDSEKASSEYKQWLYGLSPEYTIATYAVTGETTYEESHINVKEHSNLHFRKITDSAATKTLDYIVADLFSSKKNSFVVLNRNISPVVVFYDAAQGVNIIPVPVSSDTELDMSKEKFRLQSTHNWLFTDYGDKPKAICFLGCLDKGDENWTSLDQTEHAVLVIDIKKLLATYDMVFGKPLTKEHSSALNNLIA